MIGGNGGDGDDDYDCAEGRLSPGGEVGGMEVGESDDGGSGSGSDDCGCCCIDPTCACALACGCSNATVAVGSVVAFAVVDGGTTGMIALDESSSAIIERATVM